MDERWNTILFNKELVEAIVSLSPENVKLILAERGYDFSVEEIIETAKEINEIMLIYAGDDFSEEEQYIQ